MSDSLVEYFLSLNEAEAFVYGLTYGDELHWIVIEEPFHIASSNTWRVTFDRPDEFESNDD